MIFNVQGDNNALKQLAKQYDPEERFSRNDWNFEVDDEDEDIFLDEVENLGLEAQLV